MSGGGEGRVDGPDIVIRAVIYLPFVLVQITDLAEWKVSLLESFQGAFRKPDSSLDSGPRRAVHTVLLNPEDIRMRPRATGQLRDSLSLTGSPVLDQGKANMGGRSRGPFSGDIVQWNGRGRSEDTLLNAHYS